MSLNISKPAVPYGSTIVISGATGFIGSYICDEALAAGYNVRGTTRNIQRGEWLSKLLAEKHGEGKFELVEVKDMGVAGAYDDAIEGASGFIHVANDMGDAPNSKAAIDLAINGALNALKAASKAGMKRFVYTSSSFAVTQPKPNKVFTITDKTYNEEAVEKFKDGTASQVDVYAASKVYCERELVKWGKENDPEMIINMVNPNANFGCPLSVANQGYPTTSSWLRMIYDQDYTKVQSIEPQHFIDVQDDAKLHIIALANPSVQNERIFGMTDPTNFADIVEILRKIEPETERKDFPDIGEDKCVVEPKARSEELLREGYGHGLIRLEECVRRAVELYKKV